MIGNSWDTILKDEFKKDYFKKLSIFLNEEVKHKTIYPKSIDLFKALKLTDYNDVNVVILGQDPYHGENEANGLCFSVNHGIQTPPSLQNIYKELKNDLNITREDTDLSDWAKQGVLLLNTVLTVEKDKAFSHRGKGWEIFTDKIIEKLNEKKLWDKKIPTMLKNYFNDMFKIIDYSYLKLKKDGFCAIVVGNSCYGGVIIPSDLILAKYASEKGFYVDKIDVYRYIIPSSQQYKDVLNEKKFLRESVICLVKK